MARKLTAAEESECAIYAAGTEFRPADLKREFRHHLGECSEFNSEPLDVQAFCEKFLRDAGEWGDTSIVIEHERFGDRQTFDSLGDAQSALRECGDEFAGVALSIRGDRVIDERGEVVGGVVNATR